MSTDLPINYPVCTLTLAGGSTFVVPLLNPEASSAGESSASLANLFNERLRSYLLAGAEKTILTRFSLPGPFVECNVSVSVKPDPPSGTHEPFTISFAGFRTETRTGTWHGYIPALQLEGVAPTPRTLVLLLKELISIDFARRGTLKRIGNLIQSQWFSTAIVNPHNLVIEVPSPAEIDEHQRAAGPSWLNVAVHPMNRGTPGPAVGFEKEREQIRQTLEGSFSRSLLLWGPSGVGKSRLFNDVYSVWQKSANAKQVWESSAARLILHLSDANGWQRNLTDLCNEVNRSGGLLYLGNLAALFEVGQYEGNQVSLGLYLRPFIQNGEITVICECTPEEAAILDVKAPGYLSLFQKIELQVPDDLETVVKSRVDFLNTNRKIDAGHGAVARAVQLYKRFSPYDGLPGSIVHFINRTAEMGESRGEPVLTSHIISQSFSEESGLPAFMLDDSVPMPIESVEGFFRDRIIGQRVAVRKVIDAIVSVKTGLAPAGKPIGSFLFAGPTGVGKTEMSKVLAEFLFQNRSRIIRFDMTEYAQAHAIADLTAGPIKSNKVSLTTAVRRQPFSVVLFDEIEKAHPSFFDLLLQILGEGRLSDDRGHVTNFCATVIIMTSNLGAESVSGGAFGFGDSEERSERIRDHFSRSAEAFFRPELFNRIDHIVAFDPLDKTAVREIILSEINAFRDRPDIKQRGLSVNVAPDALDWLANRGYEAQYGARHTQRVIRQHVLGPLAKELNRQKTDKPLKVQVRMQDDRLDVVLHPGSSKGTGKTGQIPGSTNGFLDSVREHRRTCTAISTSPVMTRLRDQKLHLLSLLRRAPAEYWDNPQNARSFKKSAFVDDLVRNYAREAGDLETDILTQTLFAESRDQSVLKNLEKDFEDHRSRLDEVCLEVYNGVFPGKSSCVLGVYGPGPAGRLIARMYHSLLLARGAEVNEKDIWVFESEKGQSDEYAATAPGILPQVRAIYCGKELTVRMPAVYVYLRPEAGIHVWKTALGENQSFLIEVFEFEKKKAESVSLQVPGVHRKAFYADKPVRRVYTPAGWTDTNYRIVTEKPVDEAGEHLSAVLNQRFPHTLLSTLTNDPS